jgi:hypothetical protein
VHIDWPGQSAGHAYDLAQAGIRVDEVRIVFHDDEVMLARAGYDQQYIAREELAGSVFQPIERNKCQMGFDAAVAQAVAVGPLRLPADPRHGAGDEANAVDAVLNCGTLQPEWRAYEFRRRPRQRFACVRHFGRG